MAAGAGALTCVEPVEGGLAGEEEPAGEEELAAAAAVFGTNARSPLGAQATIANVG